MPQKNEIYDAVIVGAGFAGLYLIHKLREQGFSAIAVDNAPSVGGTWYWNCYPGCRCDLECFDYAYTFSPEIEKEWKWSERYPPQPEILAYANFVADKLNLRPHILLSRQVSGAVYDEQNDLWTVSTKEGDSLRGRFCILAGGGLSVPMVPNFEGIKNYRGKTYHTGHWPQGGVSFKGQRVAVIGTGSSGVQVTTNIVDDVKELAVFQRTANYTVPLINWPLDEKKRADHLAHAAERHKIARKSRYGLPLEFPTQSALSVSAEERERVYQHAWDNSHLLAYRVTFGDLLVNEEANKTAADFFARKIRAIVKDPATAEALVPTGFPFATKRPCLGKDYYEMFNRDHVRLVNLKTTPIVRFTEKGIETTAGEMEFDAVVFATGFDALTGAAAKIDVTGRGGIKLAEKWAHGPQAMLGLATNKFPNMFFITGPGSPGPLSNMLNSIEQHVEWISDCMVYARDHGIAAVEATGEAETAWMAHVQDVVSNTLYLRANSWYLGANVPGKPRVFLPYLGGAGVYREKCDAVAAKGYEGFDLCRPHAPTRKVGNATR